VTNLSSSEEYTLKWAAASLYSRGAHTVQLSYVNALVDEIFRRGVESKLVLIPAKNGHGGYRNTEVLLTQTTRDDRDSAWRLPYRCIQNCGPAISCNEPLLVY
jgi:hypothetical protein